MRQPAVACLAFAALLSSLALVAAQTRQRIEPVEPPPLAEVSGTIVDLAIDHPERGPGIWLEVQTLDGPTVVVDAGPAEDAAMKRLRLKTGSSVTVEGDWRTLPQAERVLVAHRITIGGDSLEIERQAADAGCPDEPAGQSGPER